MDRITTIDQAEVERHRENLSAQEAGYDQPCPGSRLKLDDDVQWLGFVNARIVWGHPNDGAFYGYAPDVFGPETAPVPLDVGYVNDRAPADSNEEPLPIYPEDPPQQFAQQPGVKEHLAGKQGKGKGKTHKNPDAAEIKQALTKLLASLPKEAAKNLRQYVKKHRSDITLPEE